VVTRDRIGASLEHVPCKSLAQLTQQAEASKTTVWRVTRNLCLWLYKVTQVQVIEEGDYESRTHFVTGFCGST
jgi:hypothetical protein